MAAGSARRRRGHLEPELASCASSTGAGAPVSGSTPLAVFGNAITSRIESRPAEERHDPVDAERDAAVRRRAVAQRVEQEAEARLGLLLGDPERLEDLLLHVGAVDTDRAAADLRAVEDEVVARASAARPGRRTSRRGAVNGWCSASQRCSSSFHSNIGKSTTHSSVVAARRHEAEAARELQAQLAERAGRRRPAGRRRSAAGRRAARPARAVIGRALVVGEELGDRRAPASRPPARTPTRGRRRRSA